MNASRRELLMQRWNTIQHELLPGLRGEVGTLTPKLERVIPILECVRIEEFTGTSWCGVGRPPYERAWLANAFVTKAVLGMRTTTPRILPAQPCVYKPQRLKLIRLGNNAAQNFAILRRIVSNLLRADKMTKVGIKNKRLKAGFDKHYRAEVLRIQVS